MTLVKLDAQPFLIYMYHLLYFIHLLLYMYIKSIFEFIKLQDLFILPAFCRITQYRNSWRNVHKGYCLTYALKCLTPLMF